MSEKYHSKVAGNIQQLLHRQRQFVSKCTAPAPPLLLLLVILVTAQYLPTIQCHTSADYGDANDYQINNGGVIGSDDNGESINQSDDIYDPSLLQQEVEAKEHRDYNNMLEAETEVPSKGVVHNKISNNQISLEYSSLEHENATEDDANHKISHDYEYNDDVDDDDDNVSMEDGANISTTTTIKPTTTTTTTGMIPEYVRRGKSEKFAPTDVVEGLNDETDANISLSDYVDDEDEVTMHSRQQQQKQPKQLHHHQHHHHHNYQQAAKKEIKKIDYNNADSIAPVAMKFYKHPAAAASPASDDEVDNTLKEPQYYKMQQQQQKRLQHHQKQQLENRFHQNNSEEDYDEYSQEDIMHHTLNTTNAPPPLTLPTPTPRRVQSGMGVFSLPLSGVWSKPPPTTTTTATTAPPPPLTTTIATNPAVQQPSAFAADDVVHGIVTAPTAIAIDLTEPITSTLSTFAPQIHATTITTLSPPIMPATMRLPGGKQGKQINISRRRLLPHEQLRNYVEDAYIRMPLAVIVDPSSESLEKTKALWHDALRTNLNIKIVLVSLNASGIPAAYNFNNTRQFLAGLSSIKEHNGGDAFIGILHASELVPYDSAVFISTASVPPHTELVQDAAITLLKKRIRLYLLWYGERSITENETQDAVGGILGEVAIRSGGEILHIVGNDNSQEIEGSTLTLIADAFRGSQEVDIPVDTTLSSLHVKIDSPMRAVTLETPNGVINLKKLMKFKSHILTLGHDDKRLDAYVPLTKIRRSTVFKLKMMPESFDDEYSVFVRAERKADLFLDDMIKRFDRYFLEGVGYYPTRFRNARLQSITATIAAATIPTHNDLRVREDDFNESIDSTVSSHPKAEVETFSEEEEIHHSKPKTNLTHIASADVITSIAADNERAISVLQRGTTTIEMGIHSQVLVAPGMMAQLQFEVTNTRSESIFHNIQVIDERRFLLRLAPQSIFLRPGETASVSVTVLIPNGTPQGTIDRITFTCHGGGTTSLTANLKVLTTLDAQDTTAPSLTWNFGSRCDKIAAEDAKCAERIWMIDITAQDWETGIMRLQSVPSGLIYRNSYTVGSAEPLKATYVATCCEPKLSLTAYDVAGNQRTYNIDVRDLVLTEASIAAIVLGCLLLLLLIVILIVSIVWCCRRRKVTLDLPTYRSHSTRSME